MAAGRTPMLAGRVLVRLVVFLAVAATIAVPGTAESQGAGDGAGPVTLVELDGAIDRVSARFLERALDEAEDRNSPIVVVRIDTPGGLLDATVGEIFGSTVPVVSYVAPEGAQAASAGTFVASAAAFLAMAPATNIGAAAVVGTGGEDLPETLSRKATEDAAALIRSIAGRRGRPVAPLEATVRQAKSYSAQEAVELGVADLVASDLEQLRAELDGRTLAAAEGDVPVRTTGAEIHRIEMNLFERILSFLADPNIAFLLVSLGALALAVEIWSPGLWVPGAIGVISLILGFAGVGFLPFSWAAVALLVLAVLFFVLEGRGVEAVHARRLELRARELVRGRGGRRFARRGGPQLEGGLRQGPCRSPGAAPPWARHGAPPSHLSALPRARPRLRPRSRPTPPTRPRRGASTNGSACARSGPTTSGRSG